MSAQQPLRLAHFTVGRSRVDSANGVDVAVYHLTRTQAALGHEVGLFSLTPKQAVPIPGVGVTTYASGSRFGVPERLVRDLREWRPDVLHLHSVHIPANVVLARRLASTVPYCVTLHGGLAPMAQKRHRLAKVVFRWLCERAYFERAAFLHAISERDLEGLRRYGIMNTTVLAPNGVDVEPLLPASDQAAGEVDPRLRGKRVFMTLGRLDPEVKGLDLLLRAFAAARPPNAVLVLVGPDWRGGLRRLEMLAASLGIAETTIFAGPAFGRRKVDLITAAHVLVHPSRTEAGVPLSVLEAAALGRPALLTAAADPAGVLSRAGAAVRVEPTVASIASALSDLSGRPASALRDLGIRARAVVSTEFNWPRIAASLVDAYRTHALGGRA
jgi:glycosyltransferase involved in cell wall biosynthesis